MGIKIFNKKFYLINKLNLKMVFGAVFAKSEELSYIGKSAPFADVLHPVVRQILKQTTCYHDSMWDSSNLLDMPQSWVEDTSAYIARAFHVAPIDMIDLAIPF